MSFVGNRKSVSTRSMEYLTNGQSWLPQNVVEPQDVQQPQNITQSNPSIPDEWSKTIDLESFEIPDQGEYCMIHLRPFFIPSPPSRDVPSSDLLMSPSPPVFLHFSFICQCKRRCIALSTSRSLKSVLSALQSPIRNSLDSTFQLLGSQRRYGYCRIISAAATANNIAAITGHNPTSNRVRGFLISLVFLQFT